MRAIAFFALALLPMAALAEQPCKFEAARALDADLKGVASVRFEVRSEDLHVNASGSGTALSLRGRACASSQNILDDLIVEQHREGDRLVVTLGRESGWHMSFGSNYSSLDVKVTMPATIPVEVNLGSGDADIHGVASLTADSGSGDLKIYAVPGLVKAEVGSGDIDVDGAGSVHVGSVGSGDVKLRDVHGPVSVGSIGSGELDLRNIGGSVVVDSIGSGDIDADGIKGDFTVHSKGSGDIKHNGVTGKVDVPRED